jgi:hypothetical protein
MSLLTEIRSDFSRSKGGLPLFSALSALSFLSSVDIAWAGTSEIAGYNPFIVTPIKAWNGTQWSTQAYTGVDGYLWGANWPFSDVSNQAHEDEPLTGVRLKVGEVINSIQGIRAAGALRRHGGLEGSEVFVTWPSNEVLVRIFGTCSTWFGGHIGQISFQTDRGRVMGPYGLGVGSGSNGGNRVPFSISAPPGCSITGFIGRTSYRYEAPAGPDSPESKISGLGIIYGNPWNSKLQQWLSYSNLIINGGFEDTGAGGGRLFGSGGEVLFFEKNYLKGWTAIGRNYIEVGRPSSYGVGGATGMNVVELDGHGRGLALGGNIDFWSDGFYQDVKTTAFRNYTLSVDLACRANTAPASNAVDIWWRGARIATVQPRSTSLQTYNFSVQGSGGNDRLEFRENVHSYYNDGAGGMIDNVTLR